MNTKEIEEWIDLPFLAKVSVQEVLEGTYRIFGYDTVLEDHIRYGMDETEDEIKLYDINWMVYFPGFDFPKRRATQTYYETCFRKLLYQQLTNSIRNHPHYRLALVTGAKKITVAEPDEPKKSLRFPPWLCKNFSSRHWFFLSMTVIAFVTQAPYLLWVTAVSTGIVTLVTVIQTRKDLRAIKMLLKKGEETHKS